MKTIMYSIILAMCLNGCGTAQSEPPNAEREVVDMGFKGREPPKPVKTEAADTSVDLCPPLPKLREGASRFEAKLWRETLIALYVQCAGSKP